MEVSGDLRVRDEEPDYVAHFWSAYQAGRPCSWWGEALVFTVSADDIAAFPRLARAQVIALRITEGEVHETSPEDAASDGQ